MAEAHHQVDVVSAEKPGFRNGATFIIGGLTGCPRRLSRGWFWAGSDWGSTW